MTAYLIVFALGFGCGGALIWFFRPKIAADVVAVNKVSAAVHADVNAAADAVKKL